MLSHFFRKNFVKAMVLLNKLLNSWFDDISFQWWERISRFSILWTGSLKRCCCFFVKSKFSFCFDKNAELSLLYFLFSCLKPILKHLFVWYSREIMYTRKIRCHQNSVIMLTKYECTVRQFALIWRIFSINSDFFFHEIFRVWL